jgi:hypothetical protein
VISIRTPRRALVAIVASSIVGALAIDAFGCSSTGVGNPDLQSDEAALVADGDDGIQAGDTATSVSAMPALSLDSATKIATPDGAATAAEATVAAFVPAGCATKSHTLGTGVITYTFASVGGVACTGPLGLESIVGSITATFTADAKSGVDYSIATTGLQLNGVAISQQATVNVTFAGGARTTHWTGNFTGQNVRGEPLTHQGDYTWGYDATSLCLSVDGTSSTTITGTAGPRSHSTTVTGYQRCKGRDACPQPNGTLVVTRADKLVRVIITFLGGTSYTVDVPSRDVQVQRSDLVCVD